MLINRKYQVEEVCDKVGASCMAHPYFDGKQVIATNGKIMAVIPVGEVEKGDKPGYLPKEGLKLVRKNFPRTFTGIHVQANGRFESKMAGISMERPDGCDFPEYWKAVPPADRKEAKIVVNLEFLTRLFKALGGEAQTTKAVELGLPVDEEGRLLPYEEGRAIRVRVKDLETTEGHEALGLLMPMTKL